MGTANCFYPSLLWILCGIQASEYLPNKDNTRIKFTPLNASFRIDLQIGSRRRSRLLAGNSYPILSVILLSCDSISWHSTLFPLAIPFVGRTLMNYIFSWCSFTSTIAPSGKVKVLPHIFMS